MVGRRDFGSWLNGPGAAREVKPEAGQDAGANAPATYPGERLGRPPSGPGSVARPGRRVVGIALDWALALAVAAIVLAPLGRSAGPLLVLLVEQTLLVGIFGSSLGHRAAGLRVDALDGRAVGMSRAAVRAVLLCLAVPALVWDRDQRGLHDKAAGTVIVRR